MSGGNVPGRLVAQFVNSQSILTYLPLLVFAPAITLNGMCYAMRTARLRALGGFAPLAHRLTDDLAVAQLVREAGGRIRQTIHPLAIATTVPDGRSYVRVMHRWFVFAWLQVRAQSLAWRTVILLVHGAPPLVLWAALVLAAQVNGRAVTGSPRARSLRW
jgi:ceramide glucosyltransferase